VLRFLAHPSRRGSRWLSPYLHSWRPIRRSTSTLWDDGAAGWQDHSSILPGSGRATGCSTSDAAQVSSQRRWHSCIAIGVDASEPYLDGARRDRPHPNITYELGDARRMQHPEASFDACVSTLAIDVIPEVDEVAAEMRRVTRPGGVVACCVFDFWGGNSPQDLVYDTGSVLDESIGVLRDYMKARPLVWANGQAALWRETGLTDVTADCSEL
jgi:SAM-dependent methyltransferase